MNAQPVRAWSGPAKAAAGFTLIELMVVVAIMGVLMMVAVPSFNEATLSSKLNGYANALSSSARLARSEAIKRNASVQLCVSTSGTACTSGDWHQGWIVISGTTVIERQDPVAKGYKMVDSGGVASLSFDSTGAGATTANIKVCFNGGTPGSQERMVRVSAVGKATITKTTTASC